MKNKKDPGLPYPTMVNTSPSNDGGVGSIPGWEAKICMPCGRGWGGAVYRSNIVANSIKALKMAHIKKKKKTLLKKTQLGEGQGFTE